MSTSDRLALVPLLVVLLAPVARADDERAQPARSKALEAERLYQQKDYQAALQRLDEAYALYPSAKIHYNFALAHLALGQDTRAMEAFERFLAEAPDADPARRLHAAEKVAELRRLLVWLEVGADTPGAEIVVDGRPAGTTPLERGIWVTAGPHQIVVKRPGTTFGYTERIERAPGGSVRVDARLRPVLDALTPAPGPAAANPPMQLERRAALSPPPTTADRWLRRGAWIAAGGAAASLVTSLAAHYVKLDKTGTFNRYRAATGDNRGCLVTANGTTGGSTCSRLYSEMMTAQTWSRGALVSAGILTVGSIVAFVLAPPAEAFRRADLAPREAPILSFDGDTLVAGWHLRF